MAKPVKIISPHGRRWHKRKRYARWGILLMSLLTVMALGRLIGQSPNPPPLQGEVVTENGQVAPSVPAENVAIYHHQTGEIMHMDMEDYLVGVVAAEMPVTFETEALKAQAVAARTYAYSRLWRTAASDEGEYRLTTDPATCQAWISAQEMQNRWQSDFTKHHAKVQQAVADTKGEIITWHNQIIEPLYHASCGGGKTESAKDVWGGDKPYLVSVACNHTADKHTQEKQTLSLAEIDNRLGSSISAAPVGGGIGQLIAIESSSDSNRVLSIRLGDKHYRGADVREALGLKSTLFDYRLEGDQVTFVTNGYGHGVGLCQYGANHYAAQGKDYSDILKHYYSGVTINKI